MFERNSGIEKGISMISIKRSSIQLLLMALIAFIYPPLGILFLGYQLFRTKWDKNTYVSPNYAVFIALVIAALGYHFYGDATDLHSYIEKINAVQGWSLSNIYDMVYFNSKTKLYVIDTLIYLASKSGNPYILPWMIGFMDYYLIFYMFFDFRNRSHNTNWWQLCGLVIMLLGIATPLNVISNTRCVSAYIIISFAAYRELVQKKKNILTLILYILPLWLHTSAIIFIGVRLMMYLARYLGSFTIVLSLFAANLITWLHQLFSGVGSGNLIVSMVVNAINQAYFYLNGPDAQTNSMYANDASNIFTRVTGAAFIILLILIIFLQEHSQKEKSYRCESMVEYLLTAAAFALGTLSIQLGVFWRYESVIVFLSPIILLRSLNDESKIVRQLSYLLLFGAVLISVRNVVTQINWVPLNQLIPGFLSTNGIEIAVRLLRAIV